MAVDVGDQAPDFELKDQHGTPVKLSGFRGQKNVVLVFYPLAFSGVCTGELCAMRDEFPEVSRDDVELLTVSVDSGFAHRAWADAEHFEFGLLSDFWPHGAVAKAYGVFDENMGIATRGTFIIDKNGVVRWKVVNPVPQARDIAEYQKRWRSWTSRPAAFWGKRQNRNIRQCPAIAVVHGRSTRTGGRAPGNEGSGPTARCSSAQPASRLPTGRGNLTGARCA
jgi:mycoredoxin-dependent peroxiredoxin